MPTDQFGGPKDQTTFLPISLLRVEAARDRRGSFSENHLRSALQQARLERAFENVDCTEHSGGPKGQNTPSIIVAAPTAGARRMPLTRNEIDSSAR